MERRDTIMDIDYGHFYVTERVEHRFERLDGEPDFASGRPVLLTPGKVTVVSCVQSPYAPVMLIGTESEEDLPKLGEGWVLLDTVEYRPLYCGRMELWGCTTGQSNPSVHLDLHTSRTHQVRVYAKGREDAGQRFVESLDRDEVLHEGLEEYAIVFTPTGWQEPPQPDEELLRDPFLLDPRTGRRKVGSAYEQAAREYAGRQSSAEAQTGELSADAALNSGTPSKGWRLFPLWG
ncbi:hypothetical protein [Streptomyces pilosus]|uniref:Uncharacterized protein n=1 Tax=Streptomyces pilosus TaxID=28893 RepID=A0A918C6E8_9ACTN|nr:hypothetical protein [Streptomyces pilosus]GGR08270.1 hypothetical protein GCM10010280_65100 [Streptomyces pilosus]